MKQLLERVVALQGEQEKGSVEAKKVALSLFIPCSVPGMGRLCEPEHAGLALRQHLANLSAAIFRPLSVIAGPRGKRAPEEAGIVLALSAAVAVQLCKLSSLF